MAVVKEYTLPSGVRIKINDEYYRNRTPEQKKADREEVSRVLSQIFSDRLDLDLDSDDE